MDTAQTVTDQRELNRERLAQSWAESGQAPEYPCETNHAFTLLRLMGYSAERGRLDYSIGKGAMDTPRKFAGRMAWEENDILNFADVLEEMHAWIPYHDFHHAKFTPEELAAATSRLGVKALASMGLEQLLMLMVDCNQRSGRELLLNGILEIVTQNQAGPVSDN